MMKLNNLGLLGSIAAAAVSAVMMMMMAPTPVLAASSLEYPSFIPYPKSTRKLVSAQQRALEFGTSYGLYPLRVLAREVLLIITIMFVVL